MKKLDGNELEKIADLLQMSDWHDLTLTYGVSSVLIHTPTDKEEGFTCRTLAEMEAFLEGYAVGYARSEEDRCKRGEVSENANE